MIPWPLSKKEKILEIEPLLFWKRCRLTFLERSKSSNHRDFLIRLRNVSVSVTHCPFRSVFLSFFCSHLLQPTFCRPDADVVIVEVGGDRWFIKDLSLPSMVQEWWLLHLSLMVTGRPQPGGWWWDALMLMSSEWCRPCVRWPSNDVRKG